MARSAPCVYKRGAALPVIAHLDVDCFYCQVEHRRLGIPRDEPLVVQQWESVVAVNYAARRLGIRRGDKCAPLLKKWPQLHAVHVDVLQVNEGEKGVVLSEQTQQELPGQICRRPAGPPPPASNSSTAADPYQGGCLAEENFSSSFPKGEVRVQQATTRKVVRGCPRKFVPVDVSRLRETGKVSLARYRLVSNEILSILVEACPSGVERASVDEVYLDLTPQTAEILTSFFQELAATPDPFSSSRVSCLHSSSSTCDSARSAEKAYATAISSARFQMRHQDFSASEAAHQVAGKAEGVKAKAVSNCVLSPRRGTLMEPRTDLPSLVDQRRLLVEWMKRLGRKEVSKKLREQLGKLVPELLDDALYASIAGVLDPPRQDRELDTATIRGRAPVCPGPCRTESASSLQAAGGVRVFSLEQKHEFVKNVADMGRELETTLAEDVPPHSPSKQSLAQKGGGYWPRECRFQAGYAGPPLHCSTLLELLDSAELEKSFGKRRSIEEAAPQFVNGGDAVSAKESGGKGRERRTSCSAKEVAGASTDGKCPGEEKSSLSEDSGDILDSYLEAVWLLVGAVLLYRVRRLVVERARFTMSGAVARNKFLAKTASAQFKPDKQVIVPSCRTEALLAPLDFRSLKGMRGKRGQRVTEAFPDKPLVKDLLQVPIETFRSRLGREEAAYVYSMLRGNVDGGGALKENVKVKSMLAFKSFSKGPAFPDELSEIKSGQGWGIFGRWLSGLCLELHRRTEQEYLSCHRAPKTLTVYFQTGPPHCQQYSRSSPLCTGAAAGTAAPTLGQIKAATFQSLARLSQDLGGHGLPPCSKIGMAVSGFVENDRSSMDNTPRITQFFSPVGTGGQGVKPSTYMEKPAANSVTEPDRHAHLMKREERGGQSTVGGGASETPSREQAPEKDEDVSEDTDRLIRSKTEGGESPVVSISGTSEGRPRHVAVAEELDSKAGSTPRVLRESCYSLGRYNTASESSTAVHIQRVEGEPTEFASLSLAATSSCSGIAETPVDSKIHSRQGERVSLQRKRLRSEQGERAIFLERGSGCVVSQPDAVETSPSDCHTTRDARESFFEDWRPPAARACFSLDVVRIEDSQEAPRPTALVSRQLASISGGVPSDGCSETPSQSARALLGVIASPPSTRSCQMEEFSPEEKNGDSPQRHAVKRVSGTIEEVIAVSDTDTETESETDGAEVGQTTAEDLCIVEDLPNTQTPCVTPVGRGRTERDPVYVSQKSVAASVLRSERDPQITGSDSTSEKVLCNQCRNLVSLSHLQVHLDEHMAAFLFQEANPKCLASTASQALARIGASQSHHAQERSRKQQELQEEHNQLTLDGFLRRNTHASRKTVGERRL